MRIIILFFVLLPTLCFSQFTDDFSDFEFLSTPTWFGDIDSFNATAGELNSAGPNASAVISLATNNTMIDNTEWHFKLSLGFNPSTTNFVKVYLTSSVSNIEASLNGYYIKFGETGNDSISIYRQDGLSSTLVFKGTHTIMPASSTSNSVGVKVIRDAIGNWDVSTDNTGGTAYVYEGSFLDNTYSTTSYFGVICDYGTASRATLYHFDNFYIGNIIFDVDPPTVEKVVLSNLNTVSILFNEFIDTIGALTTSHYSLAPRSTATPTSVRIDSLNKRLVHLFYSGGLISGINYTITTNGINDLASNTLLTDNHSFYVPNKNDIVINEIYSDPDSTINSLPNAEFIELFNRTSYTISLQDWQFLDASTIGSEGVLFKNLLIPANSYVIICDLDDTLRFIPYGNTYGVDPFPSLNNTDEELILQDNFGRAINYVQYNDNWYKDANKKTGGYTLERIDASKYCIGEINWMASIDVRGGTPATINSVSGIIEDSILPMLFRAAFVDSSTFDLIFSEPIDELVALNILNYQIDNSLSISATFFTSYTADRVRVSLTTPMLSNTTYTITLSNIADCSSNFLGLMNTAKFGIPRQIENNDLVINEILFNPASDASDFVELYNRSNKILDLKNIKLLEANPADSLVYTDNATITTESFLVFPDQYVVLSEDIQSITEQYFVPNLGSLLQVKGMPNYDDNEGIVELYQTLLSIDKLSYSHNWHFPLLELEEGVSLERIDYNQSTQLESNWHSAATTIGFATPTYQNSVFIGNTNQDNEITIDPQVFTPDEDGNADIAGINFKFDHAGYMLSIKIYDANGRLTKTLVNNELVAIEGRYTWDGTNDNREKARIGVYIAYTEIFELSGKIKHYKNKIILGSKF